MRKKLHGTSQFATIHLDGTLMEIYVEHPLHIVAQIAKGFQIITQGKVPVSRLPLRVGDFFVKM
jgi:hypothetical protein